jgi:hypothetical protein
MVSYGSFTELIPGVYGEVQLSGSLIIRDGAGPVCIYLRASRGGDTAAFLLYLDDVNDTIHGFSGTAGGAKVAVLYSSNFNLPFLSSFRLQGVAPRNYTPVIDPAGNPVTVSITLLS